MTVEEAVAQIAHAFAQAEEAAKTIKHSFRDLKPAYEAIRDAGHLGGIEMQSIFRSLDAIATKFEADLLVEHALQTERAKSEGIDLPAPLSGGR